METTTRNVGYCFVVHSWKYWPDSHVCGSLSWQDENWKTSFPGCRGMFGEGTPDKISSLVMKVKLHEFCFFFFSHFPSIFIKISLSNLLLHTLYLLLYNKCDYFLAFCPILVPEWYINFSPSLYYECMSQRSWYESQIFGFHQKRGSIHVARGITDFCLTWIVGSSKTEMSSLHPLAKSTLVLLPLKDQPCSPGDNQLLGSQKCVEKPVNQRRQFLTWNHTNQITPRASHKQLSGFVWSQRSCGRIATDSALSIWIHVPAVLFKTFVYVASPQRAIALLGNNSCCGLCVTPTPCLCFYMLICTSYAVLLQGKIKHLTAQYLLPSGQPGLAKGAVTWELCLAPAFWPGSSKALKRALPNSRLSTCLTVLLDQSHGGRGGKLFLSFFNCDWQFGHYPDRNMIYCILPVALMPACFMHFFKLKETVG